MSVLDLNRVKGLYETFRKKSPWMDWYRSFLSEVQYFKSLSDQDFLDPSNQEKLWRARGVSGVGPGESVNVRGAYTDQNIANILLQFRKKTWPEDAHQRAKAFGGAYDQIMGLTYGTHSEQRPQAKLARLLTALLPEDLHTCYQWKSRKNIHDLILGTSDFSFCEGAVLLRSRLREILGKEATLEEHVWRAMFCWWLHENNAAIQRGEDPQLTALAEEAAPIASSDDAIQDSLEMLSLWPLIKQSRGFSAITSYLDAFRMLVTASRGGATPDDLIQTMKATPELASYSPASCRQTFNLVRNLGFLENKDGLWYPSEEGEALVEDDPADVLVKKLLVQAFGFAQLVKKVDEEKEISKKELFKYLRELYPRWNTDFMPSSLLSWLRSLGVIVGQNGMVSLSEYGKGWAKRIPDNLQTPREAGLLEDLAIEAEAESSSEGAFSELPASEICAEFTRDQELKSFVFSERQVEALHLAWHCNPQKRFVILSGLSGTGKTALLLHYSRIYCKLKGLDVQRHQAVVAVSPDWRDPSGLLGYFNALHADPTFQIEPALHLVLSASKSPHLPFFLILDEMNMARVERYFAPFLSSMETKKSLVLHAHTDSVNGVPPSIRWPENLFIGGTVNMDETTHPFSDKVLDRAFTMEFWHVDLENFFDRRASDGNKRWKALEDLLLELNAQLTQIRRHFGYRTANEILAFLDKAGGHSSEDQARYAILVDQAIFSKVLPRIRGEETPLLLETLNWLKGLCNDNNLSMCAQKIESMTARLQATGVTRFWS